MKIDLSQLRQTYQEESAEHIALMEADLLALRASPGDRELLDSIFRAAHSIKGGAGPFGLAHLTRFTHALESLLDCLRVFELTATADVIWLLMQSVDVLRELLADSTQAEMPQAGLQLIQEFENLLASARVATPAAPSKESVSTDPVGLTWYRVEFQPHRRMLASGTDPVLLLRQLSALGTVSLCNLHGHDLPPLTEMDPLQCYLRWTIELTSASDEGTLREVFEFAEHVADIKIEQLAPPSIPQSTPVPAASISGTKARKHVTEIETGSIRVATGKVDRLIDLVGELVIAQVMTAQMIEGFEPARLPQLRDAVQAMGRSTRELHERVMAVRMMPAGSLFKNYARVLYDIAQSTGKLIRLETTGEETEVDKSMLELLGDPLTHLVRNAADHGVELPAVRAAAGKPQEGVIQLRAFHRAGRVVIEIQDDGAGIDTARVRAKALERGLIPQDALLSEAQLRLLLFEPGFSTSEAVTEWSGRGVGMDVVKRNVQQLSGTVSIESTLGTGSTVSIELPLTLAILEGLLVRVADRTLVLPLLAVTEVVSPQAHPLRPVAGRGEVIVLREESIPILRLSRFLQVDDLSLGRLQTTNSQLVVVVETGQRKIGLVVDELLGQQQVVVKSLETHLHKVEGLMGATILGDGRVAPIVDVTALAGLNLFSIAPPSPIPQRYGTRPATTFLEQSGVGALELA